MNAEPSHMFSNVNSQIISWENRALLFQCVFTAFCSLRLCVWGSARLSFSEFWHLVIGDKFLSPAFLFYAVEPGLRLQRKTLRWVNVKVKKCEWRLKTLHLAFRRATDADSVLCFLTSGFKKTLWAQWIRTTRPSAFTSLCWASYLGSTSLKSVFFIFFLKCSCYSLWFEITWFFHLCHIQCPYVTDVTVIRPFKNTFR